MKKLILLTLFLGVSGALQAQCQVTASSDTLRGCIGDTVYFSASGGTDYMWSGDPSIDCDTCASSFMIVNGDGAIIVESQSSYSAFATNGNFSQGNTGFTSQYTYNPNSIWNEGTYAVGTNPNAVHPNFGTWGDHTTGNGNYMLVNGSTNGSPTLWGQSVNFPPNTAITMEWWTLTFVTPPGALRLRVNGTNVSGSASTPNTAGVWGNTTRTFISSASGPTNVALVTVSSALAGNDFGLDDIRFSYTCTSYDTIYIETNEVPQPSASSVMTGFCDNACVEWTNTSNLDSSQATYIWDYGDGSPLDTVYHGQHCYSQPGAYDVTVESFSNNGCPGQAYIEQIIVEQTPLWSDITASAVGGYWQGNLYIVPSTDPTVNITGLFAGNRDVDEVVFDWGDGQQTSQGPFTNVPSVSESHYFGDAQPVTVCITATNSDSCSDEICINIAFTPFVEAPNVFTPNNDGINDIYIPEFYGATRVKWKVFNRWGTVIFESNSQTEGWDGTYNGRLVTEGTYFIVVEAEGAYGLEPYRVQGTVQVYH
ncbi:MAG: gliding motility-associated C-terminal domain-containing protein [Flavobacteriia bacterium]|nr:gliding motility-associated C-terminal domain-containing protein [Flavobacteriia bacterium]